MFSFFLLLLLKMSSKMRVEWEKVQIQLENSYGTFCFLLVKAGGIKSDSRDSSKTNEVIFLGVDLCIAFSRL